MCIFVHHILRFVSGIRTVGLQDTQDAVTWNGSASIRGIASPMSGKHTGDDLDLGNTVGVTENDTDLRGSGTLPGELANLVDDLVGGGLQPRGGSARVGDRGGRNALALAVKSAHLVGVVVMLLVLRMVRSCRRSRS